MKPVSVFGVVGLSTLANFGWTWNSFAQQQNVPTAIQQPAGVVTNPAATLTDGQSVSESTDQIDPERRESTISVERPAPKPVLSFDGNSARVRVGFFRLRQPFIDVAVKPSVTGRLRAKHRSFGVFDDDLLLTGTPVYLAKYEIGVEQVIDPSGTGGSLGNIDVGTGAATDFWCAPILKEARVTPINKNESASSPYGSVICTPVSPVPNVPGDKAHYLAFKPPFLLIPEVAQRDTPIMPPKSKIWRKMVPWDVNIEPVDFAVESRVHIYVSSIGRKKIFLQIDYREGNGTSQLGAFDLPIKDKMAFFELPTGKYQITIADDKSGIFVLNLNDDPSLLPAEGE